MEKKIAKTDMTYCTNNKCKQRKECFRWWGKYYFEPVNYSFCEFEENKCKEVHK